MFHARACFCGHKERTVDGLKGSGVGDNGVVWLCPCVLLHGCRGLDNEIDSTSQTNTAIGGKHTCFMCWQKPLNTNN